MVTLRFLLLTATAMAATVTCQNDVTDLTRVPGSAGYKVTRSTVAAIQQTCIFPNDYLLLERLATVTSDNGLDPSTYRSGFHGGIWQISREMFDLTMNVSGVDYDLINQTFSIDWSREAEWTDLRKPIYSALAAMLTFERLAPIPKDTLGQANFYEKHFSGDKDTFVSKVSALDLGCESNKLDLSFLLDESGSVGESDFEISKNFTATVLSDFNVGVDSVHVSVVTFDSSVSEQIHFHQYNSTVDVQSAVMAISYSGGGTNTHRGLDFLRESVFDEENGARKEAVKVAIVQTDGESNDRSATVEAAKRLKESGVIVFAICIGSGPDEEELEAIASPPFCKRVIILEDFTELSSIVSTIKNDACNAEFKQPPDSTNTLECRGQNIIKIEPHVETSIITRPELGNLQIFGSLKTAYPSSAFADFSSQSESDKPTVIYVADAEEPLYLSMVAHTDGCDTTFLFRTISANALIKTGASNVCMKQGQLAQCSDIDYVTSGNFTLVNMTSSRDQEESPHDAHDEVSSVCGGSTSGYHAHPDTPTKYVYCDSVALTAYVVTCPEGFAYLQSHQDCIAPASTDETGGLCKVCSRDNWDYGLRKFPMATNRQQYVLCTDVEVCQLERCSTEYLAALQGCRVLDHGVGHDGIGAGRCILASFLTVSAALFVALFILKI